MLYQVTVCCTRLAVTMAATVMLLLLAVVTSHALLSLPRTKETGDSATLTSAGEALEAVLTSVSHPRCSVFLFTDGTTSTSSVKTTLGRLPAPSGVGVFEVAVDGQDANVTQAELSRVVDEARRLWQVSWCVTVVVVSDDPAFLASFSEWSLKGRFLRQSTEMRLLAVTSKSLPELRDLNKPLSMMDAMLLIVDNKTNIRSYNVYIHLPYSPPGAQVMQVASWTPQRGLTLTTHLPLFPDKFFTFIYRPTLVATMEEATNTKAVMRPDPEAPGGQRLWFTGDMPSILEVVAESINFSYTYVRPSDHTWGTKLPDGSWSGMVGVVTREEADIGLGAFIMSVSRAEAVDFTWPVIISYTELLAPRGGAEVDPWGFLLALHPLVWVSILVMLLLLSSMVFPLVSCVSKASIDREVWPVDAYDLIRVLLQQDVSQPPNWCWWERLVLGVWMLVTLVLTRSYSGNLMSLLAVRYISEPYKTLREVLDDPSVTMIWQANSANVQYFRTTDQGIFHEVGQAETAGRVKFFRVKEYSRSAAPLMRQGDHVLLDAEIILRAFKGQEFSLTGRCDYHTSREKYLTIMASMITQKNSPLIPAMSNRIMRVMESGIYDQWLKEGIPNSTSCSHPPSRITVNTSLSITNIWGMFVALCTGHLLGLLVFGLELLFSRLLHSGGSPSYDT